MVEYLVVVKNALPRSVAAVHARIAASRVAVEFKQHLDQVYAARANGVVLEGQNVFVYRDVPDQPGYVDVQFGVGITAPMISFGNVHEVELPVGEAATVAHYGPYAQLRAAHDAVLAWCRANGREPAGPRWEVYGHWIDGQLPHVDIFHLLAP